MIGRSACVAVVLLVVLAWSPDAFAEPTPFDVQVEPGVGVDPGALASHLSVEVDPATAPRSIAIGRRGGKIDVRLVYSDGSEERLAVDDTDVADATAPRVLALAIGEATRLHVTRPAPSAPAPSVPVAVAKPVPPPPTRPPVPAAAEPAFRLLGSIAIGARAFGAAGDVGIEPRLALGVAHRSGVVAELGAAYLTAGASDPLGDVRLHTVSASLGVAYAIALTPSIGLRAGPRLDIGAAFGNGTSTGAAVAASTSAPVASLVGDVVVALRLGRANPWLTVALDAGSVLRGLDLRADDRTPLAALGATFGARVGLGFR